MDIRKVPISNLKSAAYNPRKDLKPGDPEYEKLRKSIETFDYIEPIIWNEKTGNIIGGHQRFKVLKARGDKNIEVVVVNFDIEKEKLANIALNKISGDWEFLKLADLFTELDTGEIDMNITGFDDVEIEKLMVYAPESEKDDNIPSPPKSAKSRLGDVYILGGHRLMCGDSAKAEDVERLMNREKANCCFTDPPYGVNYEKKNEEVFKQKGRKITGDELGKDALKNIVFPAFQNIKKYLDPKGGKYYVCSPQGGELGLMMMMMTMMMDAGIECRHMIIWKKNAPVFSMGRLDYDYQHEPILYGWLGSHKHYGLGKFKTSVWEISRPQSSKLHPTMKPVELMENALMNSTKKGDIILDLFGGSGSTLIACEKLNRKCRMMEIDPVYVDVIIKRWEEFSGKMARKETPKKDLT